MDEQALLSLGLWIKRRRKALDLTQDALAARVGCSKELIVKIEGDSRRPSREIAALLAAQLELAAEERGALIPCVRATYPSAAPPATVPTIPRDASCPATPARAPTGPSGTVTFLLTDIAGSTRLWERYPELMGDAVARHEALLRQAVTEGGGVV